MLASLESELSDSVSLRYLRLGARLKSAFLLRQKKKMLNTRMGIEHFWRRRKDLNLRAGYPTYTLSRGASSANLSTSPFQMYALSVMGQHTNRRFLVCYNIILDFFLFVKTFFVFINYNYYEG